MLWADVPAGVGGATGVDFNDDVKARWGTGNDFEIYTDGTDGYITLKSTAGGDLKISAHDDVIIDCSDDVYIQVSGGEDAIRCTGNGSVDLYYDNAKKFETVTGGATITGVCTATSFAGDGSSLTGIAATVANDAIYINDDEITDDYTVAAGKGAHSVGPITLTGCTVTVNGRWVIS